MSSFYKTALILIFASILFFSFANFALAETGLTPPKLQVDIPTLDLSRWTAGNSGNWLGLYIKAIYQYAIGIVGILAAVVLMWGGVMWLTAGGNTGQVTEAKEWIKASLTGLIIALSSYMILYIINPDLTTFKSLNIETIQKTVNMSESDASISESSVTIDNNNLDKFTNNQNAVDALNKNITLKSSASLENVRYSTINGINAFQKQFGGSLVITSGTDGDHNSGTYSHAEGFKVDLRTSDNQQLVTYVTTNGANAGTVSGFNAYTMTIGNYNYRFLVESNHLDVRIVPK